MASPFPGVDPYLEDCWGDVQHALITYARDQLHGALPGGLRARLGYREFFEPPPLQQQDALSAALRMVEMASPFPGMDPYLENFWGDIHQRFATYACDQLQGVLPSGLRARLQERVFVEPPPLGSARSMYPDLRVVERGRSDAVRPASSGGVAVAEPFRVRLPSETVRQGFIEIIDVKTGRRVVTVIEILSPSNKAEGQGRKQYERKQEECRAAEVNLVEIDLLRAGPWALAVDDSLLPAALRPPYRVCVTRHVDGEVLGEFYQLPLRERLQSIKVPLRPSDADVLLDLQALIDLCYRNGGYDDDIDYQAEPSPPLAPDDARWADKLLRKQGRRTGRAARKKKNP